MHSQRRLASVYQRSEHGGLALRSTPQAVPGILRHGSPCSPYLLLGFCSVRLHYSGQIREINETSQTIAIDLNQCCPVRQEVFTALLFSAITVEADVIV